VYAIGTRASVNKMEPDNEANTQTPFYS